MVLALLVISFVAAGPPLKTLAMVLMGLLLATVGARSDHAYPRFTFGQSQFAEGISFVAIALGLFGVSEILLNLEEIARGQGRSGRRLREPGSARCTDLRESAPAIGRGTRDRVRVRHHPRRLACHLDVRLLCGRERKLSREPEAFGTGEIAGVAGPETANNATTGSAMIPLLVLGIPAIPATAILLSALHDPRRAARSAAGSRAPRRVLGPDRQHVYRQHHAARPQSAAGRPVREPAADSLCLSGARACCWSR